MKRTANPSWVEIVRWTLRAVAVGAAALFLTSVNPWRVLLAPELLNAAGLVAFVAVPVALVFDVVAPPAKRRLWPLVRLVSGTPAVLIVLLWASFASGLPGVINRVELSDGRQYLLGIGPMPTDVDYQLWKSTGPGGLLWRPAETLTWSEDGSFIENPQLVVVGERWLMVRRGGIWTDCFEITLEGLKACAGEGQIQDWRQPNTWREASARMAMMTGAEPDAS